MLARRKNAFAEEAWRQQVAGQDPALLYAAHFDQQRRRFFNPWFRGENNWRDIAAYFMDKAPILPAARPLQDNGVNYSYLHDKDAPDSLTWLGHSSLALQIAGQVALTDPFLSGRAFTVKRSRPASLAAAALPKDCLVVISHNHYDHLDKASVRQLSGAHFICPLGLGKLLRAWGANQVQELDWWQTSSWRRFNITCLPAHHWSKRLGHRANRSLWASFLLESGGYKTYFAGDSAYFVGYKEIGEKFPGIDLALLPCGAYAPRWFMHRSHMNVSEMLQAFTDLKAKNLVPIHWASIALGHESIDEPARLWQAQHLPGLRQPRQGQRILLQELIN